MFDGMSDSIQQSRIENLHSREVDRQSPTGLSFCYKLHLQKDTRLCNSASFEPFIVEVESGLWGRPAGGYEETSK